MADLTFRGSEIRPPARACTGKRSRSARGKVSGPRDDKRNVLCIFPTEMRVSAVRVQGPHLVEVERLALGRVLGRPLAVLAVDIVHRVLRVARRDKLVLLVPGVCSVIPFAVLYAFLFPEKPPAVVGRVYVLGLLVDFVPAFPVNRPCALR